MTIKIPGDEIGARKHDTSHCLIRFNRLTIASVSETDFGHLMRLTQCRIPYRYSTDDTGTKLLLSDRELSE